MCGQLTKTPENVAGLVGSSVTLKCAQPLPSPEGPMLQWEIVSNPHNTITVSTLSSVLNEENHTLTTTPAGTYDLTIKELELKDGGKYKCKSLRDQSSYTVAEVIVFSGKTFCFLIDMVAIILCFLHHDIIKQTYKRVQFVFRTCVCVTYLS